MCVIGWVLMSWFKMILLDELSMGLVFQLVEEIFEIVCQFNENEGVLFFLVEQNINVVFCYVIYGYIFEFGCIVLDGDVKFLWENEDVKEFYFGVGGEGCKLF